MGSTGEAVRAQSVLANYYFLCRSVPEISGCWSFEPVYPRGDRRLRFADRCGTFVETYFGGSRPHHGLITASAT